LSYVIFASYGNDSIALLQWAYEACLENVTVAYSDTGWAAENWAERVAKGEEWARWLGFQTHKIASEGMQSLVERKKAWPRGGGGKFQFCTQALKIDPALKWLDEIDPDKEACCMVGIRREESAGRATFPEWTEESDKHGGRALHAPLVRHTEAMRNELIAKTPFPVLPHRSKECYPCVNMGKRELRHLTETAQQKVLWLETRMGVNSKGNDRVMFSPRRHSGAVGIAAVVDDARAHSDDLFPVSACDGGWCGA